MVHIPWIIPRNSNDSGVAAMLVKQAKEDNLKTFVYMSTNMATVMSLANQEYVCKSDMLTSFKQESNSS